MTFGINLKSHLLKEHQTNSQIYLLFYFKNLFLKVSVFENKKKVGQICSQVLAISVFFTPRMISIFLT